jgi:ribosomal protein L29
MKRKDYIDLKGKTVAELIKMASAKKMESVKKKMQILAGKEKNLKMHRNLRAEVAKILTLVREKQILEELAPKPSSAKADRIASATEGQGKKIK